jgi:hypothetical protein
MDETLKISQTFSFGSIFRRKITKLN